MTVVYEKCGNLALQTAAMGETIVLPWRSDFLIYWWYAELLWDVNKVNKKYFQLIMINEHIDQIQISL
jgi:hypothetical protein